MRWKEILNYKLNETSTSGSTSSGNVATAVGGLGAGFDPNGDYGIYEKNRKKSKVIKR